jgi:hypothetical protein
MAERVLLVWWQRGSRGASILTTIFWIHTGFMFIKIKLWMIYTYASTSLFHYLCVMISVTAEPQEYEGVRQSPARPLGLPPRSALARSTEALETRAPPNPLKGPRRAACDRRYVKPLQTGMGGDTLGL